MNHLEHPQPAHIVRISIDLETLSTEHNAAILSLGAVSFIPFSTIGEGFYDKADPASAERAGFNVSIDTMEWWNKQDPKVRSEAFSGIRSISALLNNFEAWAKRFGEPLSEIELWSRGAGFDCEILKHAFMHCFGYYPFDFRKHMCQRTIQSLMPQELVNSVPPNKEKHNALADATYQARVIQRALERITWK